jgi:hypothetical protein
MPVGLNFAVNFDQDAGGAAAHDLRSFLHGIFPLRRFCQHGANVRQFAGGDMPRFFQ